ncbi:inosine-5-monophosphate dehydrogenase [Pyrococcus furiosus DSM 3638]|uniref:Inosine-5'-monophosphate dehydrogenase related protein I n=2 Tax=Pyrococcus furiosus TaxID=2261 RepID=Q8U026_PYRFU|nr:CBS domain-containing protein [Pyrococcus furiosus]AAL81918.1 inosine-5'-monophosphate dehydrogenase related protein I [Pyrococcus furiosus DSM 3638]AFN04847.1 inosine-5'-monophosphate dehydrogenase [Pyrococcus furiosus COM1]QEK79396.1 inosine-5-monophosphate dehydrogenase [Pyrococcus furiosus DSM 3638]
MVIIPRPIDPRDIRRIRKELGITQEELARKAGVTQAYIAKLEAGKVDPRLSTFNKILRALIECQKAKITAKAIMSSPIIYVTPTDKVEKVVKLMKKYNISQVPVIEKDRVVGSITERILVRRSLEEEDIYSKSVKEIMEEPFPLVSEDEDLEVIKYLLEEHPAVIVQGKDGRPIGIITRSDIFKLRT